MTIFTHKKLFLIYSNYKLVILRKERFLKFGLHFSLVRTSLAKAMDTPLYFLKGKCISLYHSI